MERRVETNQIVRLPFLYTVSKSNNIVVTGEAVLGVILVPQ